jgi:hypothetical protein
VGKSSTLKFVCQQWAEGRLWNNLFDVVLWIDLSTAQLGKAESWESVFVKSNAFLPLESEYKRRDFYGWASKSERVLWVLDGLDEVPMSQLLKQVLEINIGLFPRLMVATRPEASSRVTVNHLAVEIEGFSAENIVYFVQRYFDLRAPLAKDKTR